MDETIRIKTTPNGSDVYLKTPIKQDFDFIEILSLKISQEDVYRKFCSDYGVIVGRVVINQGFGVPNAKVSIFIPIDEIDINNPDIKGLYPYEVITDKNSDGLRYNLLTENADESNECFTPVGSFPSKNDILDNPELELVYEKYYKFSTTTNHAGDFMIFGVPLGSYTVHVDADISNIGIASQRPYDLISQGSPIAMFESSTKFKGDKNLNKLPQVKTLNSGVNVQPFWGDIDSCEIGITRLDFDLNFSIIPSAIFMGSVFGDEGKHSVNKNCQPNRNVGRMCAQTTASGTINMIRKTTTGEIEEYDINGGRLIDDDGAWAYQIPMNLDYMVTDENGTLVFSEDPNIGVPTRARVRFKIAMDENGGEGRLRTRAKYLVPNNPTKTAEIDYEFGSETKDTSFRDLYWNKIYTVSNYNIRYQSKNSLTTNSVENRQTTGIKDVDNCASEKTPYPYNKVDTDFNPIFLIVCILLTIIETVVYVINSLILPGINLIVEIMRSIARGLRKVRIRVSSPDYVPCIEIKCEGLTYIPGCSGHGNDKCNATGNLCPEGKGLVTKCLLISLAKVLNVFELDFYNDWVNGSLFSFLLKYKKRHGNEKFCDYECNTNDSDNNCNNSLILDSCTIESEKTIKTKDIKEGLIKKFGDEFYYAATTHDTNYKMFATEIVNLGAVLDCDWQGIPKINDALIPTTYIIPPDTAEYNDNKQLEVCGMVEIDDEGSLFFTIDCTGVSVDYKGCLNLRHMCEIGVAPAEATYQNGVFVKEGNCHIGAEDIDGDTGHIFRDVFFGLNYTSTPWIGINSFDGARTYTTSFNTLNKDIYDYTSKAENGSDYVDFRAYSAGQRDFTQTKHSYYFYFGLKPGKSALDKMNNRFFNKCSATKKNVLTIVSSATPDADGRSSGTLTFKFVGGKPNYSYAVIGPQYQVTGVIDSGEVLLTGLKEGTYTINGIDTFSNPVSKSVTIYGPKPLSTYVYVSKNASTVSSSDGQITISNISGGLAPYHYRVTRANGNSLVPLTLVTDLPTLVDGLPVDEVVGHTVIITDAAGGTLTIPNLKIIGTPALLITSVVVQPICADSATGEIALTIIGGQTPYDIKTTGPEEYSSNVLNLTELEPGTYVTTVKDSLNTTASATNILTSSLPSMTLSLPTNSDTLRKQCNPNYHTITLFASFSFSPPSRVQLVYLDDNDEWQDLTNLAYTNSTTPLVFTYPKINYSLTIAIKLVSGEEECYSNSVEITDAMVTKPNQVLTCTITRTGPTGGVYTYLVTGTGGVGNISGTGAFPSTSTSYTKIITDSVGCTATGNYP